MKSLKYFSFIALIIVLICLSTDEASSERTLDLHMIDDNKLSDSKGDSLLSLEPQRSWSSGPGDMTRSREWKEVGTWTSKELDYNLNFVETSEANFFIVWNETEHGRNDDYEAQADFRVKVVVHSYDKENGTYRERELSSTVPGDKEDECDEDSSCTWFNNGDLNFTYVGSGSFFELKIEYWSFSDIEIFFGGPYGEEFDGIRILSGITFREQTVGNLQIDAIKVTQSSGVSTAIATASFPYAGSVNQLEVELLLEIYSEDSNTTIFNQSKTIIIPRADPRQIGFNWPITNGSYIFSVIIDPKNHLIEDYEDDNVLNKHVLYYEGCMDQSAFNYNPNATWEIDGTCLYLIKGCMNATAANYIPEAEIDDGSCLYGPMALAGQNSTGTPGVPLQFSGAGMDIDGTIVLYEWDFDGDGIFEWSSEDNGLNTFIYNNEGTYDATLRVTDNDGYTSTDMVEIIVSEKKVILNEDDEGNTEVTVSEAEEGLPSISIITTLISIGLLAIFRRK